MKKHTITIELTEAQEDFLNWYVEWHGEDKQELLVRLAVGSVEMLGRNYNRIYEYFKGDEVEGIETPANEN